MDVERLTLAGQWLDRLNELLPVALNDIFPSERLLDHIPLIVADIATYLRAPAEEEIAANAAVIAKARELLGLVTPVTAATEPSEVDPAVPQALAHPCPCCGGRMIVIETFEAGCQPHHRPTPPLIAIRIDTS